MQSAKNVWLSKAGEKSCEKKNSSCNDVNASNIIMVAMMLILHDKMHKHHCSHSLATTLILQVSSPRVLKITLVLQLGCFCIDITSFKF